MDALTITASATVSRSHRLNDALRRVGAEVGVESVECVRGVFLSETCIVYYVSLVSCLPSPSQTK